MGTDETACAYISGGPNSQLPVPDDHVPPPIPVPDDSKRAHWVFCLTRVMSYAGQPEFPLPRRCSRCEHSGRDSPTHGGTDLAELADFPVEVQRLLTRLQQVWRDKVRLAVACARCGCQPWRAAQLSAEEEQVSAVMKGKLDGLRRLWDAFLGTTCVVLPLSADIRLSYAGQMRRLQELAEAEGDEGTACPPRAFRA